MCRQAVLISALVAAALGGSLTVGPSAGAADDPVPGTIGGPPSTESRQEAEANTLTWSVRPSPREGEENRPNYLYDVESGQVLRDSIRVRNFGTTELSLTLYASDARTTESGAIDLLPADEEPRDVGAWIDLEESELRIPRGETVDIPFTMTVPRNAESGDHVGGIVTSYIAPGQDGNGTPVKLDRRLGSRVQVRVAGELRPGLSITAFKTEYDGSANPAGTGDMTTTYTVTNTGNVRMSARQVLEVDGLLGLTGKKAELAPMPELLPGNSLTMSSTLTGIWPALRSSADLEVRPVPIRPGDSFPALKSARASSGAWTLPWTLLLLLCLAGGVTSGAILIRRQAQLRHQEQVDRAVEEGLRSAGVETAAGEVR